MSKPTPTFSTARERDAWHLAHDPPPEHMTAGNRKGNKISARKLAALIAALDRSPVEKPVNYTDYGRRAIAKMKPGSGSREKLNNTTSGLWK